MNKLLNKRWNGLGIVLLSSIFFVFVPTSAKTAFDSGVFLMILLMARCLIGLIILAPLTYSLGKPIFVDRSKFPTLIFAYKQNGQKIIFKFNQELSYIVI